MRSLFDQMEQILPSLQFIDTKDMTKAEVAGAGGTNSLEDDLNFIRTQLKVITGKENWFDAPKATIEALGSQTNPDAKLIYEPVQVSGLAVAGGEAQLALALTGKAIAQGDNANQGANVYVAALDGASVLDSKNVVEVRWLNGDPVDGGDGFKVFGKLEVSPAIAALPADLTGEADSQFILKFFKLNAAGAMVAAAIPAAGQLDILVRRQVTLGSVEKDAFVKNASFFDVAQESNIGTLEYDPAGRAAEDRAGDQTDGNGFYVVKNSSVTSAIDVLDRRAKTNTDGIVANAGDIADIRTILGAADGDTVLTYEAIVEAAAGAIDAAALPAALNVESLLGRLRNAAINLQGQLNTAKTELNQAIADTSAVKSQLVVAEGGYALNAEITVPAFTPAAGGANMDVYYQGQLLVAGEDYTEVAAVDPATTSTKIVTLFNMRAGHNLVVVVRK